MQFSILLMCIMALFMGMAFAGNKAAPHADAIRCVKGYKKNGHCIGKLRVRDVNTNEFYELPDAEEAYFE